MELLFVSIVSLFGIAFASFFAAKVMRETIHSDFSFNSRSRCDHCSHPLAWYDMVPLLSFILLKGKCRYCNQKINPRIWFAEIIGLVMSIGLGLWFIHLLNLALPPLLLMLLFGIQIIGVLTLLYLSIEDLFTLSIPAAPLNILVVVELAYVAVLILYRGYVPGFDPLTNLTVGVVSGFLVYALMRLTKEKGIGVGDVYLIMITALVVGWPGIIAYFYFTIFGASIVGVGYALVLRKFHGVVIPLVPFISIGFVFAVPLAETFINFITGGALPYVR